MSKKKIRDCERQTHRCAVCLVEFGVRWLFRREAHQEKTAQHELSVAFDVIVDQDIGDQPDLIDHDGVAGKVPACVSEKTVELLIKILSEMSLLISASLSPHGGPRG